MVSNTKRTTRMKKLFIPLILLVSFCLTSVAKQIEQDKAEFIAKTFIKRDSSQKRSTSDAKLNLIYTAKASNELRSNDKPLAFYYVFNIGDNNGFIIVSADDVNVPIIGYSNEGSYHTENAPDNVRGWMESIEKGMQNAILEGKDASDDVKQKWQAYLSGDTRSLRLGNKVEPLITSQWNQDTPYNNQTPVFEGNKTYTGCVATAMAQVMRYYEHPKVNAGTATIPSYLSSSLGIQMPAIDLTTQSFDWNNMVDRYGYYNPSATPQQNEAVAKLMYYCGSSVKMDYGIVGSGGSGAVSRYVADALYDYFDYDKDIVYKARYSSSITGEIPRSEWISSIQNELDNQRVVYFSVRSAVGGHAIICDGYDENDLVHFNFGWGGYQNAFYDIDAPLEYVRDHAAIMNIKPNEGGVGVADLVLLSFNSSVPESVYRKESFRMSASVSDMGLHNLVPELYVALYNDEDELVSVIGTREVGAYWIPCLVPESIEGGVYTMKMVEKDNEGNYLSIKQSLSMTTQLITVSNEVVQHSIRLRGEVIINSNATEGKAGDSFQVGLSFVNSGSVTFTGYYGMALTDVEGEIKSVITSVGMAQSLNPGSYYPSYTFFCKLPSDLLCGHYNLQMVAKEEGGVWGVVRGVTSDALDLLPFEVTGDPTSLEQTERNEMIIELVNGELRIESPENELTQVDIYDLSGRLVLSDRKVEMTKTILLQGLAKGAYIVKVITTEGNIAVSKINK